MRSPDELRALAEGYVADLALTPELGALQESLRYAAAGGKRVRATICLATAEASGAEARLRRRARASVPDRRRHPRPRRLRDLARRGRRAAARGRGRGPRQGAARGRFSGHVDPARDRRRPSHENRLSKIPPDWYDGFFESEWLDYLALPEL